MSWNKQKVQDHIEAAKRLDKIMASVFKFIKEHPKTTEYEVLQFILKQYKKHNIKNDANTAIVAFGPNTSHVHYHPSQYYRVLKPNNLILIDIWGRLNKTGAPYADITWMGYYGKKMPRKMQDSVNLVFAARDKALNFVKTQVKKGRLPTGKEVDEVARNLIDPQFSGQTDPSLSPLTKGGNRGVGGLTGNKTSTPARGGDKVGVGARRFLHGLGHELGFTSPHGSGRRLNPKNVHSLKNNMGYTIEPGAYIKNKFGVRSEIDFYVDNKNRVIVTTKIQKTLVKF